jgi:hypothetical protein
MGDDADMWIEVRVTEPNDAGFLTATVSLNGLQWTAPARTPDRAVALALCELAGWLAKRRQGDGT